MRRPVVTSVLRHLINTPTGGRLFLASMPGRHEPLDEFVQWCHSSGVNAIACLTSTSEIRIKAPAYAEALNATGWPFRMIHYNVEDYSIPNDISEFEAFIREIVDHLGEGNAIVLHCAGGIGRTGMTAACLLVMMGIDLDQAFTKVKEAGSGAETEEQRRFIQKFTDRLP